MSALKTGLMNGPATISPGAPASAVGAGYVLPRWLRRPARAFGRLTSGEVEPPRFAATIASAILLVSAGLGGMVLGGHSADVAQAVTARTGFAIEDIKVSGHRQTSEIDIFEKVGLSGWTALIGYNVGDARARIATLPWVETVSVRKTYPSTLEVQIVERVPFAVWQHGRQLAVVDAEGGVIAPISGRRHANLPLVIGMGAAERGSEIVAMLQDHGGLASRVVGYIRVADRRWDLRLDNGVTIRLPEDGTQAALRELVALDREHDLLSRDIAAVDLRFADRIVLRLTPEGLEYREAALKQRLGRINRPERRI